MGWRTLRSTLGGLVLAGVLVARPFSLDSTPMSHGTGSEVVRVNDACGQPTECVRRANYICIGNEDHEDYRCSPGCNLIEG